MPNPRISPDARVGFAPLLLALAALTLVACSESPTTTCNVDGDCDDGDPCTVDACDMLIGLCEQVNTCDMGPVGDVDQGVDPMSDAGPLRGIPANTNNCVTGEGGGLDGGEEGCVIEFDAMPVLDEDQVTVDITATLTSGPAIAAVSIYARGENGEIEPVGHQCGVSLGSGIGRRFVADAAGAATQDQWDEDTENPTYSISCRYDYVSSSGFVSVTGGRAPDGTLERTPLNTSIGTRYVMGLRRSRVDDVRFSSP